MAKSASQIDALRERLNALMTDWEAEISAVMHALDEALARVEELERRLDARDKPAPQSQAAQHAEVEAMRAELAARKSLVKRLRSDAERGKALERELAQNRQVIETMKDSIERDARTIAELRLSANSWERKYRRLIEAGSSEPGPDSDRFSYSDVFTDTGVAMFLDETTEADGARTVVIDMTEPLREAREARRRNSDKS